MTTELRGIVQYSNIHHHENAEYWQNKSHIENIGISSPPQYNQDHPLKFLGQSDAYSYHANHSALKS
jgi:hypothetical protein